MGKVVARNTRRKPSTNNRDVPSLLEHFSNHLLGSECQPSTAYWYQKHLKIVFARLKFQDVASWQGEAVVKLVADMVRAEYSDSYIYNIYRTVKRFDEFLVQWKYIPKSQSVKPVLSSPKKPSPEIYPLYPHQVEAMLHATAVHSYNPLRDKAIISVFYDSGIRRGELATLKLDNVKWDKRILTVTGKMGTRSCSIGPVGVRDLKRYVADERPLIKDEPHAFLTQTGTPLRVTHITQIVERIAERAEVTKEYRGPHALRHGFAYAYIMNGGNALTLSTQLGHEDMDMTKKYVRLVSADTAEVHAEHSPMKNMRVLAARTELMHGDTPQGKAKPSKRVRRRTKR